MGKIHIGDREYMTKATYKSDEVEGLLKALTGKDRRVIIEENGCVLCDERADQFRDELSLKEYQISGYCQPCQDEIFGTDKSNWIAGRYD